MRCSSILVLSVLFLTVSEYSFGQQTRIHTRNTNGWFMYFGNHKISDRFGIHAEAQLRRFELIKDHQQLLIRTGLDYYLKDNSRITAGYAYIETFPYGEFAVQHAFPEHRTWQQFQTSQTLGKIRFVHRYRLEQRFIGNSINGTMQNARYENRIRYMARITIPLAPDWKTPVSFAAYDEVFVNFGKQVAYNIFDQNRLYAAFAFSLTDHLRLEAGYLYQMIQLRSLNNQGLLPRNRIENNHTLQVALYSSLPFYRGE
jgi:long-subunit fatty acid transport protein